MSIQDAQIIVEKINGTVPKNANYVFPFKITAPNYGQETITKVLESTNYPLGTGKVTEVKTDSEKYSKFTDLKVNNGTALLIKSGDGSDALFSVDSVSKSAVQVGTGNPTESLFLSKGFTDNSIVGELSTTVNLNYANGLGSGFIYKKSVPDLFDRLSTIQFV
ncbi:hypothetical protein BC351_10315 [Paenibacillus ferrarius]|uniref:Uncharacterized protein n=1 Tax=Paenibacillus ferrarius TaxID=1469647 RepID=A0A1V4H9Z0_9BACL|nr:hypothetical protein [Paenibacillus ferrarius]OPH47577.1 hypothetical protein BC351_10315 [Paenibacillus ferrarius]